MHLIRAEYIEKSLEEDVGGGQEGRDAVAALQALMCSCWGEVAIEDSDKKYCKGAAKEG